MNTMYLVILIIGSITLSKKIRELTRSIKNQNKEKIKADVFFLGLSLIVMVLLLLLVHSKWPGD